MSTPKVVMRDGMLVSMVQQPDMDLTDDIATGMRRAHQYLRFLEVDPDEAAKFLQSVTSTKPHFLVAMGAGLRSIARGINQKRTESEQTRLQERFDEAQPLFEDGRRSKSSMQGWVRALAEIARGEVAERFPDPHDRIKHHEAGARMAYEGGDPESPFRKVYGKGPSTT